MRLRHNGFRLSVVPGKAEIWFQASAMTSDPADALRFVRLFDPGVRGTFFQTFLIISALRNTSFVELSGGDEDGVYQDVTLLPNVELPDDKLRLECWNWDPFFTVELFGTYDTEEYATKLEAHGFVRVKEGKPTLPM